MFLSEFGPGEHFASRADRPSRRLKSHETGDGQLAGIFPNPFFISGVQLQHGGLEARTPIIYSQKQALFITSFYLFFISSSISLEHSFVSVLSQCELVLLPIVLNKLVAYREQKKAGAAYGLKLVLLIWHCKVTYVLCRLPECLVKFMA